VKSFRGTTDPFIADQMAKDCLLLAPSGVDLRVIGEMAETSQRRKRSASKAVLSMLQRWLNTAGAILPAPSNGRSNPHRIGFCFAARLILCWRWRISINRMTKQGPHWA
jgi:hypothetical protein